MAKPYTKEIKDFLFKNYKNISSQELADKVNNEFGTEYTASQMRNFRNNNKLRNGLNTKFKKGDTPKNKGKKMTPELYEKCKATMFKKGNISLNKAPIGTIVPTFDGYLKIKIADPNIWEYYHRYIWQQHYGDIPAEMIITFLDCNRANCDIKNLELITKKEHVSMARKNLRSKDADLTKTGLNVVRLQNAILQAKKDKNSGNNR